MYFLKDQKVPKNLVTTKISLRKKLNSLKKNAKGAFFLSSLQFFTCEILMSWIKKAKKTKTREYFIRKICRVL